MDHGSVRGNPIFITCIRYHDRKGREMPNSVVHDLTHIIADASGNYLVT